MRAEMERLDELRSSHLAEVAAVEEAKRAQRREAALAKAAERRSRLRGLQVRVWGVLSPRFVHVCLCAV